MEQVNEQEKVKQTTDIEAVKAIQTGVDSEARLTKKAGKLRYAYKEHIASDENGLVLSIETTAANEHDSLAFEKLQVIALKEIMTMSNKA